MKNTITLIFCLFSLITWAQPKVNRAVPAAPTAAPKPKGPPPYVLKKDFDELINGLKSDVAAASATNASLRRIVNSKDAQINSMEEELKKINDVLNSTQFKVDNTSDSLNQTRFSLDEMQRINEARYNTIEEKEKAQDSMFMQVSIGIALLSLILFIFIFISMNKKITSLKNALSVTASSIEQKVDSSLSRMKSEQSEQIRAMSEENQFYSERWANTLKSEAQLMRGEIQKLNDDIQTKSMTIEKLHSELNDLKSKITKA